jgi:HSP20 family molecular chaperone IbpA
MLSKKLSLLVLPFVTAMSLQAQNPFNDPFFNDPFGDDIFKEMLQMQKEMDQMFSRMQERRQQRSSGLVSPLGTYKIAVQNQFVDKGDVYELLTNIPESKENHIDVKTENGIMSVSAKIVQEQENKTKYSVRTSRSVQMYQQSTPLPQDADENSIKVGYKNGKLVITISKNKTAKSATVKATTPKVEKEIVKKAESSPKEVSKEVKKDPVKSNAVEITDEFNQTPKKETKEEKPVENKKTTVGDKESMI